MRDQNGFKCHIQSESHVRQMLLVGEDPNKHISDYSNQFQHDFLQLLRTAHGEKKVHMNHFYQEYISNKEHVHMNATRWPSLTEFAKYLGREGICRVEDTEKGLHVSWIDNSPEALRRQDAIRKKERQDRGDEEREQKLIREQVKRAELDAEEKAKGNDDEEARLLKRKEGEKIKLHFGSNTKESDGAVPTISPKTAELSGQEALETNDGHSPLSMTGVSTPLPEKMLQTAGITSKPKNVFTSVSKKNMLGAAKSKPKVEPKKPITEAERIMKEEIERKRVREANGFAGLSTKRQKVS